MHAQQAARAYHERAALTAFATGFVFTERGALARLVRRLPAGLAARAGRELRRREITEVPAEMLVSYPWLEVLRTAMSRYAKDPVFADFVWDVLSHRFDRTVARRRLDGVQAVHAFEYVAAYTFGEAARRGIARILSIPSIDSKEFEEIRRAEEARFPELRDRRHGYFAARFSRRYDRRRAELALADVIVANSEVTRRSHIRAGADPAKIVAVPLAGPPPIAAIGKPAGDTDRPLSVLWAGNFTLGKGAHYFLDAWRALVAGDRARATVYGAMRLPERILRPSPPGMAFIGSVPQSELFAAFERADILVFPTLADGFGLVVTEAFSRGLPVITTDRAGASDLVRHRENGLIVPAGDATALADALRWCLDSRSTLYRMRWNALATASRWQWPDHRRLLIASVATGLRRAGYDAEFGPGGAPEIDGACASACPKSLASAS